MVVKQSRYGLNAIKQGIVNMFTLENTARATHARWTEMESLVFFDFSGSDPQIASKHLRGWFPFDQELPKDCFELSRPQSDIQKLFEGAPEWATGYAKFRLCKDQDKYWIGKDGYLFLGIDSLGFQEFGKEGAGYQNFIESEFTIIATRPECKPAPEPVSVKPVYTQEMVDNGEHPPVGVDCLASLGGSWFTFRPEYFGGCYVVGHRFDKDREVSIAIDVLKFKPIDTRTDEEKAVESLNNFNLDMCKGWQDDVIGFIKSGEFYGVKWVGDT